MGNFLRRNLILIFLVLAVLPPILLFFFPSLRDWFAHLDSENWIALCNLWVLFLTILAVVGYLQETRRLADAEWAPRFGISVSQNANIGCRLQHNFTPTVVRLGWYSPYPIRGTMEMQYTGAGQQRSITVEPPPAFAFWAGFVHMNPTTYCLSCLNNQIQAPQQDDKLQVELSDLRAEAAIPRLPHLMNYEFDGTNWVVSG